jgi:antitoxin MazE
LPAGALERAGLSIDDPVEVREEEGRIVIEPVKSVRVNLDELIAGITEENRHEETDWGAPQGREFW